MVFSFLSYLISFQRYSRFLYYANKVLMTSYGVTIWKSKHKVENISASNDAKQLEFGKHVVH